jgi:hypothetical protein
MPGKRVPQVFAVMTMDPGTTSGVARGVFAPGYIESGMLADVFQEAKDSGQVETWETEGPTGQQAAEIAEEYRDWGSLIHIQLAVPWKDIHFVTESFELRPNKAHGAGSDKNMLDPVRVISGVDALFEFWNSNNEREEQDDYMIEYQTPQTGTRMTSDRLRAYDAWVVGSEHRRDAMRHLLQKASDVL